MKRLDETAGFVGWIPRRQARRRKWTSVLCAASALSVASIPPALAQSSQDAQKLEEIIVTARKREESILKAPVVVTVISNEQLEDIQVTQITDLPKLVPGLVIGGSILSIGPQVTIRGVGTSSLDPGVEQSVSLNIDGLSLSQGLAYGSAMFDVGQVEVLKGPQALFYGKSSPGGVIALRTADPGDTFELIARAGYEFEALEPRGEFILSGPLTETLRARLATMYSEADGFWENHAVAAPGTGAVTPDDERQPRPENFVIRGTLLWEPMEQFSARLKLNHVYDRASDAGPKQLANCPDGPGKAFAPFPPFFPTPVPFIGGDDCVYNREVNGVFLDPASFPGIPNNGVPYLKNDQDYGTLELNYDMSQALTLTSTTAYYELQSSSSVNPTLTTAAGPTFAVTNQFRRREFTQEFRLNSDYSGPLNFTVGAFYEDGQLTDRVRFIRNRSYVWLSPFVLGADILNDDRESTIDIETLSLFGQLRYRFTDKLELAGGVRWDDEERQLQVFDFQNNVDLTPFVPRPSIDSSNYSPEATITYTPTDDLTAFASFKKGYKSGSYSVAVPTAAIFDASGNIVGATDQSFDDEEVQGYEIGLKSRWLDRSLLANIAFYDYEYDGLQVGANEPAAGGVPVIRTVNSGKARTYGVDLELAYRPPAVAGLGLNASVNWNHPRYEELTRIPCYNNQTIALGCTLNPDPFRLDPGTGRPRFSTQELSGTPMIRAPEWAVNFGFDYELPLGSSMTLQLTSNNQYTSEYVTYPAVGRPSNDNFQSDYFTTDAGIALKSTDNHWEVAVIGKNLTDELVASNCSASNAAGSIILPLVGGDNSGGVAPGTAGTAEKLCFVDGPGRSIWLRLTFRPF